MKNTNLLNKWIRTLGFVFLFLLTSVSYAQFTFITGINAMDVRNDNLLQNTKPLVGLHIGIAFRQHYSDSLNKISLQYELIFNQKGYQQKLDRNYIFSFNYLSAPILFNYSLNKYLSLSTGMEPGYLLFTNKVDGVKKYNRFDLGLILGLSTMEHRRLSIYSRLTYGLVPMLDYYRFDRLGNITEEIHDLKNICLSLGIKVNVRNEK